jgi:hypothetical protein
VLTDNLNTIHPRQQRAQLHRISICDANGFGWSVNWSIGRSVHALKQGADAMLIKLLGPKQDDVVATANAHLSHYRQSRFERTET